MILFFGLVLLTASALTYLVILQNVYGNYDLSELLPTKENLHYGEEYSGKTVAILYSKYTENMLPEGSTWLHDNIDTWKRFLTSNKVSSEIISDQTIELGQHFKYKLLVLPGSKSLSDIEVEQIKKFIEKGGSVYSTTGIASFSDNGKWRGWDFINETFGLNFTKEIKPEEIKKLHTLRGGLPLTAGIPSGYSLKIATWDRPMACEVLDPRTTQLSFWYNFRSDSGLVREELEKSAGIAYGTYGSGRFIWMGFELSSVVGEKEDYVVFDKLFRNSVNWLLYLPTAFVKDWPGDSKAAAIVNASIGSDCNNIRNLFGIIKQENLPVTFYMDAYTAEQNQGLAKELTKYGSIGAVVDLGIQAVSDNTNRLYDYNTQFGCLKNAKSRLESVIGRKVESMSPLYGVYNEFTIHAMLKAGYHYLVTDSLTDRAVPKLYIKGDENMLAYTKTARDDNVIVRDYGLKDPGFQLYTYQEDVDRLLFQGGLYVLKLHTDYQCRPEYVRTIHDLAQYIKGKGIWLASEKDINYWWKYRNSLTVQSRSAGKRRVYVEISNFSDNSLDNVVVQVNLNKKVDNIRLSADKFGQSVPPYTWDKENQTIYIKLMHVAGREALSLAVDFDLSGA
jgi:peptidoglycan/xylan/chitin deacetylase (PgdA/CDA1 family)